MIGTTNAVNKKASETEKINLTLQTNQSSHTDLNGVEFSVSYGSYTKSYTWQGTSFTIEVPAFVEYTITFGAIDDYATPAPLSYVAQAGNSRTVTAKYNTEIVSVTLSADNGQSVNGQIVTINGTQHTWNGTAITQKVAFGTEYTVSVNDKDGYTTPASQSATASQSSRNFNLVYAYKPLGVFIQGVSGKLYNPDDWTSQETANGVAVCTEHCSFVIALEHAYSISCMWGGYGITVSGITTTEDLSVAKTDYDGEAQTTSIVSQLGSGSSDIYAAKYCREYTFPNGDVGYLGAAGEWQAALDNKNAIASALNKCGGEIMSDYYWTSTQYSHQDSWYMRWDSESLTNINKDDDLRDVRAFAAI